MESQEQISLFYDFVKEECYGELVAQVTDGKHHLDLAYSRLLHYSPDLVEDLLDNPTETLKACEIAIGQFDIAEKIKRFNVRIKDLPDSVQVQIRHLRTSDIGKLVSIKGLVRQKSDIRPYTISAVFECPQCGGNIIILQTDNIFKKPLRCSCGRKDRFRLVSKEQVDGQWIVLEEIPEELEGGAQPKRLNFFLQKDLTSRFNDERTNPGAKIIVSGVLKEIPVKEGSIKTTRSDFLIEANYVCQLEDEFSQLDISEEEIKEIESIGSSPDCIQKLIDSFAPDIYGHTEVKEALLLQLFSGMRKIKKSKMVTRGDIHCLLVGDPSAGKSQLLRRATTVAPKSRYISGKGSSGAGLTAAVVKDEFMKGWALEAGALVLANNGNCYIDELDKMSKEDSSAMHEALEQQIVSIAKANIQATLKCQTTVTAAANPKWGRFDPYDSITKQIDMPSTLISRFDLIFIIRDIADKEKDIELASFILGMGESKEAIIPTDLLRKYISYAKINFKPVLSKGALEEIRDFYVSIRNMAIEANSKSLPISARQLEALVRLTEATAKARLSNIATRMDAKRAIDLMQFCLYQVGVDPESGQLDIDRISASVSSSERGKLVRVMGIISLLEKEQGREISIDIIKQRAELKSIISDDVDNIIDKLKRSGDIFEPRKGLIQKL